LDNQQEEVWHTSLYGVVDYIKIDNGGKSKCTGIDKSLPSTTLWFKGEERAVKTVTQTIFANMDLVGGNVGGLYVEVGDGTANNHGQVFFTIITSDSKTMTCESDRPDGDSGPNYLDGQWHHFAATYYDSGKCKLWIDGIEKQDLTGGQATDHIHNYEELLYLGSKLGVSDFFKGTIDDLMYWNDYVLTDADVTALHEFSFGENGPTKLNFFISNATGIGNTVDPILASDLSYSMPWSDPGAGLNTLTDWAGGNYTVNLPAVTLRTAYENRLNVTMSFASGDPITILIDESELNGGSEMLSSFLQVPHTEDQLPTFLVYDNDNMVTLFIYNAGEGAWLTYQGTRVIFNGTDGHYAGVISTVNNGVDIVTLSPDQDGPFIPKNTPADVNFWHPRNAPASGQPSNPEKVVPGMYDVTIFLNGYDEIGALIVRSINIGAVEVID